MKRLGLFVKVIWPEILDKEDIIHLSTVASTRKEDYQLNPKLFYQDWNIFLSRILFGSSGSESTQLILDGKGGISQVKFYTTTKKQEVWEFKFLEPTAVFSDDHYQIDEINRLLNATVVAQWYRKYWFNPANGYEISPHIIAEEISEDISENYDFTNPKVDGDLNAIDRPIVDTSLVTSAFTAIGEPITDAFKYIMKIFTDIIYDITKSLLFVAIAIGIIAAIYFYYKKEGA